jgi:hypothetical protein
LKAPLQRGVFLDVLAILVVRGENLFQRRAAFVQQAKQQMLGADKIILELVRLLLGGFERLTEFGSRIRLAAALHLGATGEFSLQVLLHARGRHSELLQQWLNQPFALPEQREQQMFAINGLMSIFLREPLRVLQRPLSLGRESVELHIVTR